MKYECTSCNYSTTDTGNWNKHVKTVKHIANISANSANDANNKNTNSKSTKELHCRFCNSICHNTKSLFSHFLNDCQVLTLLNEEKAKVQKLEQNEKVMIYMHNKEIKDITKKHDIKINRLIEKHNKKINMLIEKHDKYVEKQTDDWKDIAKTNANIATISTSANTNAVEFLTQNFTKTQPIEKITHESASKLLTLASFKKINGVKYDDNSNSDDSGDDTSMTSTQNDEFNDASVEQMIFHYKNNNLCEHIANLIVGVYKKKNPNEQTIWNSDESRLVYIIRDVINKENKWIKDQKGEKIKEYVVKPILNVAKEMIMQYCDKHRLMIENNNIDRNISPATLIERIYDATDIVKQINNKKLEKKIITEMSAPFGISICKTNCKYSKNKIK
jgi:hypothetical protein